jgi:predicted nucleotidyltransferase
MRDMSLDHRSLLARVKALLGDALGPRFLGVILYGSEARGEAGPDSDIDLLVLLEGPVEHWRDSCACIDALYGLVLELERPIHAKPVDVNEYRRRDLPLYLSVKAEGIPA